MLNSFKLSLQYILPKLWLTRLAGWGASKRAGWLTKLVIDLFVKYYKVDMKEAQKPDTASYRTFNDFFVRPLRDDVRPINTDPNVLVMPADGVINQLGNIEEDKLLQAKGHSYTLEALLAGNYQIAAMGWSGDYVHPMTFMPLLKTGDANNNVFYSNPAYDALVDEASVMTDAKAAMAKFREADALASSEYPVLPLYYKSNMMLMHDNVAGYYVSTANQLFLRNAFVK